MKNICVITGTRADYGLLKGILNYINTNPNLNLLLFVTGSHLELKYGLTYKNIEEEGFIINEKINMNLIDDSPDGILQSMALELSLLSKCFLKYNIDMVIILGDRYEMLIVAQVALINNIPISHICGGDVTEGAYDNSIRNAITKMSTYHFVSCKNSYNNIIKMGICKNKIFLTGNPGLYDIINFKIIDKNILFKNLNINILKYIIVIVFHPETLINNILNQSNFDILIDSLMNQKKYKETTFIFIKSNADNFNNCINENINKLSDKNNNIYYFDSLKRNIYINLINNCDLFIGNSSSGIYEVPLLNKITLNIGNRQKGRIHGNSVINIDYDKNIIIKYIENILNKKFKIKKITYPYELLDSSKLIVQHIEDLFL